MDKAKREKIKTLLSILPNNQQGRELTQLGKDVLELIEDLEKSEEEADSLLEAIQKKNKKIESLEEELASTKILRRYCWFCGAYAPEMFSSKEKGEWLDNHVRTCPSHPMRELERKIEDLEQDLLRYSGSRTRKIEDGYS